MLIAKTIEEFRRWRTSLAGARLGFVPTMGALHEGHLELMREAKCRADEVAVSIFVNPTQFAPNEDLKRYPRDFGGDEQKCAELGVGCIFYPAVEAMYPDGFKTFVEVEDWGRLLEGKFRPTHFRGVTTVVLKLFNIIQPDVAVFGWKDAQQFIILRKMAADLDLPIDLVACETKREPDGLAMSSRNAYLSAAERRQAPVLHRALHTARELVLDGDERNTQVLKDTVLAMIERESAAEIDYVAVVSLDTLEELEQVEPGKTLIALAAKFGKTRLLDNIRF